MKTLFAVAFLTAASSAHALDVAPPPYQARTDVSGELGQPASQRLGCGVHSDGDALKGIWRARGRKGLQRMKRSHRVLRPQRLEGVKAKRAADMHDARARRNAQSS